MEEQNTELLQISEYLNKIKSSIISNYVYDISPKVNDITKETVEYTNAVSEVKDQLTEFLARSSPEEQRQLLPTIDSLITYIECLKSFVGIVSSKSKELLVLSQSMQNDMNE